MAYTLNQLQGMTKNNEAISTFDPTGMSILSNALKGGAGSLQALQGYNSPRDYQFDYSGVQTPSQTPRGITQGSGGGGSQYTALERQRIKALDAQKLARSQQLEGQYNLGRANLAGQSQQSARNIAEYLAQRGLTNSGVSAQSSINNQGFLMQGLGGLEEQRAGALSNLEAEYQQGVAQAQAEAQAQAKAEQEAEMQRQIETIGAYGQDYQAEINRRMAANPNDPLIPYLQMARQQKLGGIAESETKAAQQEFENQLAIAKLENSRRTGGGGGDTIKSLASDTQVSDMIYTVDQMGNKVLKPNAYESLKQLEAQGILSPNDTLTWISISGAKPTPISYTPEPFDAKQFGSSFVNAINAIKPTYQYTPGSYVPLKDYLK